MITIPAQSGTGFKLKRGDVLKVIDLHGEQVADLFCFSDDQERDALSSGRSIDYNETVRFTTGHTLFGNSGQPLLKIIEDTCGVHDFLVTPCSQQMFTMISGSASYHPSCLENLTTAFEKFDLDPSKITTTFNTFMNVPVDETGRIRVLKPTSRKGDYTRFEAQTDLICALTACSDEGTNGGICKPVGYEIEIYSKT